MFQWKKPPPHDSRPCLLIHRAGCVTALQRKGLTGYQQEVGVGTAQEKPAKNKDILGIRTACLCQGGSKQSLETSKQKLNNQLSKTLWMGLGIKTDLRDTFQS